MKIYKIKIGFICLIVAFSLSQMLHAQNDMSELLQLTDSMYVISETDMEIDLIYHQQIKRDMTGSVEVIDVQKELKRDHRTSLGTILNGKVPGLMGNYNTWGTGNAVILVDGIPQNSFYLSSLNLLEIETIAVLKDAHSKALYGAQADQGVILVTTKRGQIAGHKVRVVAEHGVSVPRAMPQYLNAADYMERYVEAQVNDGLDTSITNPRYLQEVIDATRRGDNSARYPDNEFYTPDYIKDFISSTNVFADVVGGNQDVRYYLNTSWNQNTGWLNTPQGDITNRFNFRGNLDFVLNEYMDMSVDAAARVRQNTQPNAPSIWNTAANDLPNLYPMFWDPALIASDSIRDAVLANADLVDGQLLGGTSSYQNNRYGDIYRTGNSRMMERMVQFNSKLNIDLSFIAQGLSAKMYAGMNFYNSLATNQSADFAVYEPFFNDSTGLVDDVIVHGTDTDPRKYSTNSNNSTFSRQISYFGTLNYKRSFGDHSISALAMYNNDFLNTEGAAQKTLLFHTGIAGSYTYDNTYIAEFSYMGIGSRKLPEGSRVEMTPSFGLAWVVSEEDFMSGIDLINYLKLRSSYGITKNDNWDDYYLHMNTFERGNAFQYNNRTYYNDETSYVSVANNIYLQKRRDISVGLDAALLDRALNIELGYFNSHSLDNITLMSSTYPQVLGFEDLVYNNYNSSQTQGIELGLDYTLVLANDLSITAGANMISISPKITQREEPNYEGEDIGLIREGTASDAMWGLKSDGLYGEEDFNPDGSLIAGLPVPKWGAVQPGDIKYLDQNSDDVIDTKDVRIIGNGTRTQYALFLDVKFKNFGLYVLGIGQMGDYNYRSGNYFRVYGNDKYSVMVDDAYGPNNKDVNASHPRLSAKNSNHNDRNSDYWIYENNSFVVPTMQLSYHFSGGDIAKFLNDSKLYLKATNLVIGGKNKQYTEINPGGSPRTKGFSVGLVTSF
jgi:TonB-linked SusC/RagA family outer membrane protein